MMSSKYELLAMYLQESGQDMLRMTFEEIEKKIRGKLPPAAWEHRAWWANSETNSHARHGWMSAGYETSSVDMEGRELVFLRAPERVFRLYPSEIASPPRPLSAPSRRSPIPSSRGRSEPRMKDLLHAAGGTENLMQIVSAIQQYIDGDLLETELGRILRKLWPRR
jgi:hypothetical protein